MFVRSVITGTPFRLTLLIIKLYIFPYGWDPVPRIDIVFQYTISVETSPWPTPFPDQKNAGWSLFVALMISKQGPKFDMMKNVAMLSRMMAFSCCFGCWFGNPRFLRSPNVRLSPLACHWTLVFVPEQIRPPINSRRRLTESACVSRLKLCNRTSRSSSQIRRDFIKMKYLARGQVLRVSFPISSAVKECFNWHFRSVQNVCVPQ